MAKDIFNGKVKPEYRNKVKLILILGPTAIFAIATALLMIPIFSRDMDPGTRIVYFVLCAVFYLYGALYAPLTIKLIRSYPKHILAMRMFMPDYVMVGNCDKITKKMLTKQGFAKLAEGDDNERLLDLAFDWTSRYCPIGTEDFSKGSVPVRNVQIMLNLHFDVSGGGFAMFYLNDVHLDEADYEGAFRAANLNDLADIFVRAQACFETIKDSVPQKRNEKTTAQWYENNPLDKFDDEYDTDAATRGIADYIKANISHFGY